MFDFFRSHIKLMMGLLVLLIIPSFVLFGIEGYRNFGANGEVVARVAGTKITRPDWDAAHRQEAARLMESMPTVDRAMFDTEAARLATLERMVNERLMAAAALKLHLTTTDQRLAAELLQDANLAMLRKPDGTLDIERYRLLVGARGMTPEMFENQIRGDLARRQVVAGVSATGLLPAGAAQPTLNAFFERREVQVARFAPADFRAQVQVSDADIEAYYRANAARYQSIEQADIEYLVLDLDAVARSITLNEADVKAYYDQNTERLSGKEQRRASHILLTVDAKAPADEKAKVRAQAQALLDQVRQAPQRFAEIAKAKSQDPGSAPKGGDLDFFGRGAMVKAFEDAAFALQKGQISGLVESEFGFHIIQLTDIRKPATKPFEAVRAEIEADLKRQQAQRRYAEAAESFTNLVYEQADSLKPAADKLKLTLQTARNVTRQGGETGAPAYLASPKLLKALFAEDSTRKGRNTEAVETAANQLVAARVTQYRPAALRPLPEVAAQVREALTLERARELAVAKGKAQLEAWKAQPASASLPAAVVVSRNQPQNQPAPVVIAALSAPLAADATPWVGVDLGAEGYAVLRVNKSLPREAPPAEQARQETASLSQMWAQAEAQAYVESLRKRFKAETLVKKPG